MRQQSPPTVARRCYAGSVGAMILLLVPDRAPHLGHQLRRCTSDSMLLGVFHRVLQDFVLGLPPDYVLAPGRRINLGALDDLAHDAWFLLEPGVLQVCGNGRSAECRVGIQRHQWPVYVAPAPHLIQACRVARTSSSPDCKVGGDHTTA